MVLLRTELPNRNNGVGLPVSFLLQWDAEEGLDVAGGVDHAGAVGGVPQCQDMVQSPGGVDHDHVTAGASHPVEKGKHAVVHHLDCTQEQVVRDEVCIVEPEGGIEEGLRNTVTINRE